MLLEFELIVPRVYFVFSLSLFSKDFGIVLLQQIILPNTRYYALVQVDMVKAFGVLCVVTNDSSQTTYYALVQENIVKRVRRVSCSMALHQHK